MMKIALAISLLIGAIVVMLYPESIDPQCQFILSPEKCAR